MSDRRFGLFTDMVRLILWAQIIFQFDKKEKVQEHYMWSNITLENSSYLMQHNAILMRIGYAIGELTLQIKVTRLERNTLLERGMDLNSLTWLLVTLYSFKCTQH